MIPDHILVLDKTSQSLLFVNNTNYTKISVTLFRDEFFVSTQDPSFLSVFLSNLSQCDLQADIWMFKLSPFFGLEPYGRVNERVIIL